METFDMSKLTRRKPNMENVVVESYEDKAVRYALEQLKKDGLTAVCVDAIHNIEVTKDNWVKLSNSMYVDTIFYDGWKIG